MTIDRRAFWTDVASGLVLAILTAMFKPQVIAWTLMLFLGFLVGVFILDKLAGGTALDQVGDMMTDFIQSRTGG